MKKIFAAILALSLLPVSAVFAETDTAAMETALLTVKSRVEIPADLTEFESRTFSGDRMSYTFCWQNEDRTRQLEVLSDGSGNISDVNMYDASWYASYDDTPHLFPFTGDAARQMAEAYLTKLVPAAFADEHDRLVYDKTQSRGNINQSTYNVGFVRTKNGIPVPSSSAQVRIRILEDGAQIASCSVQWDYDAEFADAENLLADSQGAFQAKFPLELSYQKIYAKDGKTSILLEYTLPNAGTAYIDAKTGEILTEDAYASIYGSASGGGSNADMKEMATAEDAGLSRAELQELENVAGLLSPDALADKLRAMPELKLSSDMTNLGYYRSKQDEDYFCQITLDNTQNAEKDTIDRYTSAQFNAKTGEILSIYNRNGAIMPLEKNADGTIKKLTTEEVNAYRAKADAFLEKYFPEKTAQVEKTTKQDNIEYTQNSTIGVSYSRLIQGIPYPDNYIQASWSANSDWLSRFSSEWDSDISGAPDKAQAITPDAAYQIIFDRNPLEKRYISSGGTYKVVYALGGTQTTVNAITGKLIDYSGRELSAEDSETYTDITDHWAGNMIRALAEYDIRLPGETFQPDARILQADYLMLLCDTFGSYYQDIEHLYERLINKGILTEAEKAPQSTVKKEDAIQYLLRMMGIQKVAELQGIFICDFPDASQISPEKVGYCAIAKGFGFVAGDGGNLYPQKELSRAEAVTLLYQFLTK